MLGDKEGIKRDRYIFLAEGAMVSGRTHKKREAGIEIKLTPGGDSALKIKDTL